MPKLKPFQKGDKAIVNRKPLTVTMTIAKPNSYWYYGYYCKKCNHLIKLGDLYGRASNGETYCLKCCDRRVK